MALLQISEPGLSPAPHERRVAIGIDLGTTHSLVAAVRHSVAQVLQDEHEQALLPSAVYYESPTDILIGQEALALQRQHPLDTLVSTKRLMGKSLADAQQAQVPYRLSQLGNSVAIDTTHATVTPVEVAAQVLMALRQRAQAALGDDLVGAVITVPAYFDDAQRQATRDAARIAGLTVLRLLNEPTAAALAYGLDNGSQGVYAVYDLGGGTFDFSLLRLTQGVFEVIATGGDTALGGDDFDRAIVTDALQKQAPDTTLDAASERLLLRAARQVREQLTTVDEATQDTGLEGALSSLTLTRADLDRLSDVLIERSLDCVKQALLDAEVQVSEIHGVVMVGGATRMPVVQRKVGEFFKTDPLVNLNPDEVVAIGAAKQANLLAGNRSADEDWLLLDVTPLSLGLETMGGLVETIITRNSTIPVARAQEFTTYQDGQTAMSLHVVQGERDLVSECRSLARFELRGIPAMVAGAARIRVTFQIDADGLLNVTAREMLSGVESSITVKPSHGLSDEEIARMLQDGVNSAESDAQDRMLREQQVQAQQLLESVQAALDQDADLLEDNERNRIDEQMQRVKISLESHDTDMIHEACEALSRETDDFAAKRMDRSIRAVLTGRTLDEL
ncbi:Fe-S protein assembly chaperone HscA [Orrella sp. 11846]|uniref:Fe-S protein assembly chaperone HscA n=1 Tax=Orrella sp. 11846 TaxID=3409913 RepID=UPI003B58D428